MPYSSEYILKISKAVKVKLDQKIAHQKLIEAFEKDAGFLDKFKTFVTTVGVGALLSLGTPEAKATAKDVENQLKDLSSKTYEKFKNDKNIYMELKHDGYKTFKEDEDYKDGVDKYKFKIKVGPYETEGIFANKVDEFSNTAEIGVKKDITWKVVDKDLLEKMKKEKNNKYDVLKSEVQSIIDSMEANLSKGHVKVRTNPYGWWAPKVRTKLKVKTNEWVAESFDPDLSGNPSPAGRKYWNFDKGDGNTVNYDVFQKDVIEGFYDSLKNDKNLLEEFQLKVPEFEDFKENMYDMFGKDPKKFYENTLSKKMKKEIDDKIKYKDIYPKK